MNTTLNDKCTVANLIRTMQSKNYRLFTHNNNKEFNLNIICVRSKDRNSGTFNDIEVVMWQDSNGKWLSRNFSCTTDPSDISLRTMKNKLGTAIIKEGQYNGAWAFGLHKNDKDHPALIQVRQITVIRDFNKDNILNIEIPKYDFVRTTKVSDWESYTDYYVRTPVKDILVYRTNTGLFGIDNHRASKYSILNYVGAWSEGCSVQSDYKRYMEEFIDLIKQSLKYYPNSFTITILDENSLVL